LEHGGRFSVLRDEDGRATLTGPFDELGGVTLQRGDGLDVAGGVHRTE
jgi:hypothetical protein